MFEVLADSTKPHDGFRLSQAAVGHVFANPVPEKSLDRSVRELPCDRPLQHRVLRVKYAEDFYSNIHPRNHWHRSSA